MRRTAMAVVGLVLAGWGAGALRGQDVEFQKLAETQEALRILAEETGGFQTTNTSRDRERPRGAGIIRGIVTAAATGAPVRGATVRATLASGDAAPATATTDDNGAFELRGLVTGDWRVGASKSGFVPRNFGQRGTSGGGSTIAVNGRDAASAGIALVRGGALIGHVFDEYGDPAVGSRVQAMQFTTTENGQQLVPAGVPDITDDTGAFRVYGLMPGDYLVSARAPTPFDGDTFVMPERLEPKFFVTGASVSAPRGLPRATASTYFPGTTDVSGADRVTIGPGEDRGGVDFALTRATLLRVAGTLANSAGGRPAGAAMIMLGSDTVDLNASVVLSRPVGADGAFEFPEVPPGSYRFTVAMPGPGGQPEMADVPLRLTEDVTGLDIVTTPGATLTGTVVSDSSTPPPLRGMLFQAQALAGRRPMFTSTSGAVIDGAFQVPNLLGAFRLAVDRVPTGWIVKAIEIDGVDVTDTPVTFASGQRSRATVVLTNRIAELSGLVTNDGKPVEADIAIFPDDPAKWTSTRFVRSLSANAKGTFSLRGLPPHDRYLAVATEYLEQGELRNPEFLELLRSRATSFSLEQGQSRRINLPFVERSDIDGR